MAWSEPAERNPPRTGHPRTPLQARRHGNQWRRPPPQTIHHSPELFLFFLLLLAAAAADSQLRTATDLETLLAFKAQADPGGALASSWLVERGGHADFCSSWKGVACSRRHQRVTELSLPLASLAGTIPPHIGNLSFLVSLDLSNNNLTGPLPAAALARLRRLRYLDLSSNLLAGSVPAELGVLPQLREINLSGNRFGGEIPPELGNLTNLESFTIEGAQVEGEIPPELGKLANVQFFSVASNMLSGGFPTAVYNMSSLRTLVLANNSLSGSLPSDLGRQLPPGLEGLYVSMNSFTGAIPASLSNASAISILELSYNGFQGTVPPELGALQQLVHLTVTDNNLSGRLDFLGPLTGCRNLLQLNLRNNNFNGTLPASAIGNFTKLERFVCQGNFLEGGIPPSFGNLTNLTTLVLSYNRLSGPIPLAVVALPKLERLYLEVNRLEGRIPLEIGSARRLGLLYLQVNKLSGPIPNSIGNLTAMQQMNLAENELSSAIPPGLWRLTELTDLNLSHNALVGSLPETTNSLSKVTQLDLSANRLSGGIPETIVDMVMLAGLSLASNNFSGPIPSGLGSLVSLETLDVSSNFLSGNIPPSMAKPRHLQRLNLSFNNLEGEIPKGGVFAVPRPPGISNESFAGNPALCGDPWSGLSPCEAAEGKAGRQRSSRRKYIIIGSTIAGALFLVIGLAAVFLQLTQTRKMKKKTDTCDPVAEEAKAGHRMVTYHELVMATDGFSEANLLGVGSFGKVYRGRLADGSLVAVKVLNRQMGEAAWRSFDAECRVMRAVRHRNLVGIITTCSNLEFRALVLPLMPNGSLEWWLHRGGEGSRPRLSLLQTVEVAVDVASALEYLHHGSAEPVIHCDLKPGNVLLDAQMVAHLGDFGIGKVLVAENSMSATRTSTPGTFGYMAPEYGMAGRVTTKGDVYSYGILLLEAFTGVRPTDARFVGDMNLRRWVASAFLDNLADIVDNYLLEDQSEEPYSISSNSSCNSKSTSFISYDGGHVSYYGEQREREQRRSQCIVAMIELGLTCSLESPKERPDMVEVAERVKKIREALPSPTR